MLKIIIVTAIATVFTMTGCSTPRLVNGQTAEAKFATLSAGGKSIASTFYGLGSADAVKRLYWSQRRMQEQGGTPIVESEPLKRKLVVLPVPAYQTPEGTIKEASTQVVEVVQ